MSTAYYADQSDPACNVQFRRRWNERLDAATIDRIADRELQLGHVAAAEFLSLRAEALREAGR